MFKCKICKICTEIYSKVFCNFIIELFYIFIGYPVKSRIRVKDFYG